MTLSFSPSRSAGLDRLAAFVPQAGAAYAARRNFDLPGHPHVSGLSPWIRHRLLTEEEVLAATLTQHDPAATGKFIEEVLWRTYWKGWLERRPGVWTRYRSGLRAALNRVATEAGLRRDWEAACRGETGIDAFDHWARELITTGYLHNHARMWFASIWIFTLRLPWELGADFFLRHLLDGDPASNTLSWRWVGGLQTPDKTYLATPDNIARYTGGRFRPTGLATTATPLTEPAAGAAGPAPQGDGLPRDGRIGLLLTEDDLAPDWLLDRGLRPVATAVLTAEAGRSPLEVAPAVRAFVAGAAEDVTGRLGDRLGPVTWMATAEALAGAFADWASEHRLEAIVTPWMPVGPAAEALDGADTGGRPLARVMRPLDSAAWPHAGQGFFRFRKVIPGLIAPLAPTA